MSIQRRLAISITLVLLFSLVVGFGLTYVHVLSKVRTEMQAALNVGAESAANAIEEVEPGIDPTKKLHDVVTSFNGDRHLRALLTGADGKVLAQSRLSAPDPAAPSWFYHLVVTAPSRRLLDLPTRFNGYVLALETDPHNEVAEAWSDAWLTLTIMAVFFTMVLVLAFVTIRAALRPLRDVCDALLQVGSGDYAVRIVPHVSRELEPLRDGFNSMAERLADMSVQNRTLNEQILNLQEEERSELARDLHDDVAPFLFAVGADAAMIRQFLAKGTLAEVSPRAEAIAEAVKHMQHHLKDVLRRLAPSALLDLGLAGAIDNLIGFWKTRCPNVVFDRSVTGEPLDPPLDAIAFRVVQESFSNAVRHGAPSEIDVTIDVDDDHATIVVEDDGKGFPAGKPTFGFGLTGMQERVRAVGGKIAVRNRKGVRGVIVEVVLPIRARRLAEVTQGMDQPA